MNKTENWAAFGSEYLKAIDVLKDTDEYAIVSVESRVENNKETLILNLERGELKKKFGCNKTNAYAIQQVCPQKPTDAVGRVITFTKVRVAKPNTEPAEMVDGLRLRVVPQETVEPSEVDTDNAGLDDEGKM